MRRSPNIIYVGDTVDDLPWRIRRDYFTLGDGPWRVWSVHPYYYAVQSQLTPTTDGPQSRSRDGGSGEGEGWESTP